MGDTLVSIMRVEEGYLDVLQNIEFAIFAEFRRDPTILDMNVLDAVTALTRRYDADAEGRVASPPRLSDTSRTVYEAVAKVCEFRLGRGDLARGEEAPDPLSPPEMVACLKRLRKSIDRWNKQGGRQGYLSFVQQYII